MTRKKPGAVRGRPKKKGIAPLRGLRIPEDEWQEIRRKCAANGYSSPATWIRAVVKMVDI